MSARSKALDGLLIKRATEGLTDREKTELERLLQSASIPDTEIFERAAAAIHVGRVRARARLPEGLRRRLEQQGTEYLASKHR